MILKTLKPILPTALIAASLLASAAAASASDGKALFDTNCAKCHGPDGKGATKMGMKAGVKDFTDATVKSGLTDAKIATIIKEGFKDGDKIKMKAFPDLSADDVSALVSYVKAFK